jgi:cytochrome c553
MAGAARLLILRRRARRLFRIDRLADMMRTLQIGAALACLSAAAQAQEPLASDRYAGSEPDEGNGRAVAVGALESATGGASPDAACFRCHGIDGAGDPAASFPRLTGQVYGYLHRSLEEYASGVRENPIMTPIAQALTEQERRDVSAYYASLDNAPHPPQPEVDLELLQYGAALAAVGSATSGYPGCVNCHGPEGVGLGPNYPFLAGQHENYLEAQLLAWRDGARGAGFYGLMAGIAKRMSDREIAAVSAYYASIRPAPGAPGLAQPGIDPAALPENMPGVRR